MTAALLLATLLAAAGLVMVTLAMLRVQSVVHAAVLLMGAILCVAASMLALAAGLAAALMLLVHAGAIVTVMLFVAVTLPVAERGTGPRPQGGTAGIAAMLALILAGVALTAEPGGASIPSSAAPAGAVGALLFGPWAVAVELASLLLLVALLGARLLLRKGEPRP